MHRAYVGYEKEKKSAEVWKNNSCLQTLLLFPHTPAPASAVVPLWTRRVAARPSAWEVIPPLSGRFGLRGVVCVPGCHRVCVAVGACVACVIRDPVQLVCEFDPTEKMTNYQLCAARNSKHKIEWQRLMNERAD